MLDSSPQVPFEACAFTLLLSSSEPVLVSERSRERLSTTEVLSEPRALLAPQSVVLHVPPYSNDHPQLGGAVLY